MAKLPLNEISRQLYLMRKGDSRHPSGIQIQGTEKSQTVLADHPSCRVFPKFIQGSVEFF